METAELNKKKVHFIHSNLQQKRPGINLQRSRSVVSSASLNLCT